MKLFQKNLNGLVMIIFMALALVACGSDDDDNATMDIVETAVADGRFTTLVHRT